MNSVSNIGNPILIQQLVELGNFARSNSKRNDRPMETLYFLGFTLYCGQSEKGRFVVNFKTERTRFRRSIMAVKDRMKSNRHLTLREQILAINQFLSGLYRYYGVSSNVGALERIYKLVYHYWRKALSSRSQTGYVNWVKYATICKHFPILKPKIYNSFEQMRIISVL